MGHPSTSDHQLTPRSSRGGSPTAPAELSAWSAAALSPGAVVMDPEVVSLIAIDLLSCLALHGLSGSLTVEHVETPCPLPSLLPASLRIHCCRLLRLARSDLDGVFLDLRFRFGKFFSASKVLHLTPLRVVIELCDVVVAGVHASLGGRLAWLAAFFVTMRPCFLLCIRLALDTVHHQLGLAGTLLPSGTSTWSPNNVFRNLLKGAARCFAESFFCN